MALDAASRGLRTALVEKGDFASGTSSKSSKMIHGGLRYLQQREFRLVYENLAERQRLLDNAPHLVTPLPFLIPLFGRDGVVVQDRGPGLLDRPVDLRPHRRRAHRQAPPAKVAKDEALAHLPTLRTDHLVAGLPLLRRPGRRRPADPHPGPHRGPRLRRRRRQLHPGRPASSPARRAGRRRRRAPRRRPSPFAIRARSSSTPPGVWADAGAGPRRGRDPHSIRPAKGIHVTVPADRFPCDIAAVIPVPEDKRSIFVVSWPGDLVYLGTTDTDYDGPLDDPACTPRTSTTCWTRPTP